MTRKTSRLPRQRRLTAVGELARAVRELLSAASEEFRSFGAVGHPQDLVGGAQMLLYCGLREEEALAYFSVGEPLDHVPEDLPLADGEGSKVRRLLFAQQVVKQFTRRNELALRSSGTSNIWAVRTLRTAQVGHRRP